MPNVIQDLWIIQRSGIVLFTRVCHEIVDENLFGALMSAFNIYFHALSGEGLSGFKIKHFRFTLLEKNRIIFIANSSEKVKDKVMEELKVVAEKFFKLYPVDFLEEWTGNVTIFSDFEKVIQTSFEEPIEFQQALW